MKSFSYLPVLLLVLLLPPYAAAGEVDAHADKKAEQQQQTEQPCRAQEDQDCPPVRRKPVPRRAVPDQRPFYVAPAVPPAPSVQVVPPVILPGPATSSAPSAPAPLGSCDGAGCWNPNGGRYNGGTGDTYLNGGGRLCNRNGVSVQCF